MMHSRKDIQCGDQTCELGTTMRVSVNVPIAILRPTLLQGAAASVQKAVVLGSSAKADA